MEAKVYEFQVEMTCEGCSGAVKRVLSKLEGKGVNKFDISLETQRVAVESTLSSEQILETIKKTGKPVTYIGLK